MDEGSLADRQSEVPRVRSPIYEGGAWIESMLSITVSYCPSFWRQVHGCVVEIGWSDSERDTLRKKQQEGCLGGLVGWASILGFTPQVMISRFCGFKPHLGLCASGMGPAWGFSLPAPPTPTPRGWGEVRCT